MKLSIFPTLSFVGLPLSIDTHRLVREGESSLMSKAGSPIQRIDLLEILRRRLRDGPPNTSSVGDLGEVLDPLRPSKSFLSGTSY